ncbi:MAG TPA: hypothetical protein ENG83_15430 [Nitrospirae bacterium]|nr:phosphotransferase enzyme family protein [bacterium BMS3Abin06]HDH13561.1 hypothetical protein [Nitrospirota bacterium]HDZ00999.1 hypothetical protein [Nitrospirota bacterium]
MKKEITGIIQNIHQTKTGRKPEPEEISLLMYASRNADINFIFINGSTFPHYVIKSSRNDGLKQQLRNEYDFLLKIYTGTGALLKNSVPEPLAEGILNNSYYVIQSAVNGMSLNEYLWKQKNSKPKIERLFAQVTEWLVGLHACGDVSFPGVEELVGHDYIAGSLERFRQQHGLLLEEKRLISHIFEKCTSLTGIGIPLGQRHGDFSPWNIRFNGRNDKMFVLDWEYADTSGMPITDLLNFFVVSQPVLSGYEKAGENKGSGGSFSRYLNIPLPELQDFQKAFYDDTWQARLMQKCIVRYCEEVGIDTRLLDILFLVFILDHLYRKKDFLTFFLQNGVPSSLK